MSLFLSLPQSLKGSVVNGSFSGSSMLTNFQAMCQCVNV